MLKKWPFDREIWIEITIGDYSSSSSAVIKGVSSGCFQDGCIALTSIFKQVQMHPLHIHPCFLRQWKA